MSWVWLIMQRRALQGGGISRQWLQPIADLEASFIRYAILLQGILQEKQTMSKDCKKTKVKCVKRKFPVIVRMNLYSKG